jgi:hypothetical protein
LEDDCCETKNLPRKLHHLDFNALFIQKIIICNSRLPL